MPVLPAARQLRSASTRGTTSYNVLTTSATQCGAANQTWGFNGVGNTCGGTFTYSLSATNALLGVMPPSQSQTLVGRMQMEPTLAAPAARDYQDNLGLRLNFN